MIFKPLFAGYKAGPWGWNAGLMPVEEFKDRLKCVKQEMAQRGIDALLVFGVGDPTWKNGNVCYLTNGNGTYARKSVLIILKGIEPTLIGNFIPRDLHWEMRNSTWLKDIRIFDNLGLGIERVLQSSGKGVKRVGLVGVGGLDVRSYAQIVEILRNINIVDATDVIENMRVVKSSNELRIIEKGCRVADMAIRAVTGSVEEGDCEYDLIARIDMESRKAGARNFRFLIASGSDIEMSLRMPVHHQLKKGDTVLLLLAFEYWQYWVQIGRTLTAGNPSEGQIALYRGVVTAYEEALKCVRPEMKAIELAEAIVHVLDRSGYKPYLNSDFGFGHGVGVSIEEKPFIDDHDVTQLRTGMTLAIQLGIHAPGIGGVLLSDTLLLTRNGCQRLTQSRYDL
jgi:Xaa-Pro aminopeptidase